MIKKSTLVVVLCALILGAAAYYFEQRQERKSKPPEDTTKPAFSISASEVTSFTLSHPTKPGEPPIRFEKRNGAWKILQPVETEADEPTAQGIVDQLAEARVSETFPGGPDRRKAYGLDPPQSSIEFQLQNGAKHSLLIGDKDFAGSSVYTIVDGAQTVSLLPESLSSSAGKSLDDLRDRAVLHLDNGNVASFVLKNPGGELDITRDKGDWKFSNPASALADKDSVDSLLSMLATAKMASIASERPENLSRYGLASPAVTFTATTNSGQKSTLHVGSKDGDTYFARDPSRTTVFRIQKDLYTKLTQKFGELRDKKVVRFASDDVQQVHIESANGALTASRKKDAPDEWMMDAPVDQKGKSVSSWKFLDPIGNLKAEEVIDHPAADLVAALAKPAVTVVLTAKNGQQTTVRISKPSGDFAYAQVTGNSALFKLKKQAVTDLSFKPADLVLAITN